MRINICNVRLIITYLFIFCFIYSVPSHAQLRTFSKVQLEEDFDIFQQSLEKYNPGLYTLTPKSEYDLLFRQLKTEISEGMSDTEFFKILMYAIEKTNEAHFRVSSGRDIVTNIYKPIIKNKARYLPLQFKFIEGKAYLWADFSARSGLKQGDEILAINGDSMPIIIDSLFQYIVSDGYVNASKYARLDASFSTFYYWFFAKPFVFKIKAKVKETGKIKTVTIPAIPRKEMLFWMRKRYPNVKAVPRLPFYDLEIDKKESIAYLKLRSYASSYLKKDKVKPKKVFKKIFADIQQAGIQNMVIDLRDNGGGHKKFTLSLLPYLLQKDEKGVLYTSTSYKGRTKTYKIPKRSKLAFDGKMYALVNESTFSAGANTGVFLREFSDATIVGEESAGRYLGFVAGSNEKVILPNSRIPVYIPRWEFKMKFVKKQLEKGRGVLPDYRIIPTIDDLIAKKDVQKDFVINLIKKDK